MLILFIGSVTTGFKAVGPFNTVQETITWKENEGKMACFDENTDIVTVITPTIAEKNSET